MNREGKNGENINQLNKKWNDYYNGGYYYWDEKMRRWDKTVGFGKLKWNCGEKEWNAVREWEIPKLCCLYWNINVKI